jgi:hypothetical protein
MMMWYPDKFMKEVEEAALSGIEEWGRAVWVSQAREDAPVSKLSSFSNF